jgi:hypothetical protein
LGSAPQATTPFYLPTRWSGRDLGAVIGGVEDNEQEAFSLCERLNSAVSITALAKSIGVK